MKNVVRFFTILLAILLVADDPLKGMRHEPTSDDEHYRKVLVGLCDKWIKKIGKKNAECHRMLKVLRCDYSQSSTNKHDIGQILKTGGACRTLSYSILEAVEDILETECEVSADLKEFVELRMIKLKESFFNAYRFYQVQDAIVAVEKACKDTMDFLVEIRLHLWSGAIPIKCLRMKW